MSVILNSSGIKLTDELLDIIFDDYKKNPKKLLEIIATCNRSEAERNDTLAYIVTKVRKNPNNIDEVPCTKQRNKRIKRPNRPEDFRIQDLIDYGKIRERTMFVERRQTKRNNRPINIILIPY